MGWFTALTSKACTMSSDGSKAEETKYKNTLYEAEIFA
jgi:hypothetical protein